MNRRDTLLAFVPPLCWGTGFTIAKPAVGHFPPLLMLALIYAGVLAVLVATARDRIKTDWMSLLAIAACSVTIQGALIFWGLRDLPASVATLIVQIQVPFAVVLGWVIGGEKPTLRKAAGTLIALAGVTAVVGLPSQLPPLVPVAAVILGSFFWSLGQVLTSKLGRDDGLTQLKGIALFGLPQLIAASWLLEQGQWQTIASATVLDWATLGFVAIVGFYIAYAVWFGLLRRRLIEEVAPFTLLMPIVGLITAWLVLQESVAAIQLVGGAVILLGLAVVGGLVLPAWLSPKAKGQNI